MSLNVVQSVDDNKPVNVDDAVSMLIVIVPDAVVPVELNIAVSVALAGAPSPRPTHAPPVDSVYAWPVGKPLTTSLDPAITIFPPFEVIESVENKLMFPTVVDESAAL